MFGEIGDEIKRKQSDDANPAAGQPATETRSFLVSSYAVVIYI